MSWRDNTTTWILFAYIDRFPGGDPARARVLYPITGGQHQADQPGLSGEGVAAELRALGLEPVREGDQWDWRLHDGRYLHVRRQEVECEPGETLGAALRAALETAKALPPPEPRRWTPEELAEAMWLAVPPRPAPSEACAHADTFAMTPALGAPLVLCKSCGVEVAP